ncbi:MAG: tRNA 2-selenouridine(34) synthase MnmH [Saprospiraceae bacterium]|nr:tRNA 2-selenouridine(34) synthase MnmH [Saprospiraceae bacterium]
MAIQSIDIKEFLKLAHGFPVFDVRSPSEFLHAHIPGAINLPLFSDEERAVVGTAYKQESRAYAIKKGLDFFGPKMRGIIETVEQILDKNPKNNSLHSGDTILLHCWRGGMRSAGVAWLLDLYGFKVCTLQGGYKIYRNWVREQFVSSYHINVLGGFTGAGKTILLRELEKRGEKIIDLEGLASHKGSAFGKIGMPDQPSQVMFENLLAFELFNKSSSGQKIWMEDESQRIGHVNVPKTFWLTLNTSPVFFLDIPFEERLDHLVNEYGGLSKEQMVNAIIRIQKRLGGLETKNAINFLLENNTRESFSILLKYYDKSYNKSLQNKKNAKQLVYTIPFQKNGEDNVEHLVELVESMKHQGSRSENSES